MLALKRNWVEILALFDDCQYQKFNLSKSVLEANLSDLVYLAK